MIDDEKFNLVELLAELSDKEIRLVLKAVKRYRWLADHMSYPSDDIEEIEEDLGKRRKK